MKPLLKHARGASVANVATDVDVHRIILEGLKSIVEGCGENLVSGWDVTFDIIGTVFDSMPPVAERRGSVANPGLLTTRSSKLVRSAFSSLQLICSDFLASLPNSCFLILVDTLYKFCSQDDDLNIALTVSRDLYATSLVLIRSRPSRSSGCSPTFCPPKAKAWESLPS